MYLQLKPMGRRGMAFHIDLQAQGKRMYRLSFSTAHKELRMRLGKVAEVPLTLPRRWSLVCVDTHALLQLVTAGQGAPVQVQFIRALTLACSMVVQGVWTSDAVYTPNTLHKDLALPLPTGARYQDLYAQLWVPSVPEGAEAAGVAPLSAQLHLDSQALQAAQAAAAEALNASAVEMEHAAAPQQPASPPPAVGGSADHEEEKRAPAPQTLPPPLPHDETPLPTTAAGRAYAAAQAALRPLRQAAGGSDAAGSTGGGVMGSTQSGQSSGIGSFLHTGDGAMATRQDVLEAAQGILKDVGVEGLEDVEGLGAAAPPPLPTSIGTFNVPPVPRELDLSADSAHVGMLGADGTVLPESSAPDMVAAGLGSGVRGSSMPSTDPVLRLSGVMGVAAGRQGCLVFAPDGKEVVFPVGHTLTALTVAPPPPAAAAVGGLPHLATDSAATSSAGSSRPKYVLASEPTPSDCASAGSSTAGGAAGSSVEATGSNAPSPSRLHSQRHFPGHTHDVVALAMAPDGGTLASAQGESAGGKGPCIRLWDFETAECLGQLTGFVQSTDPSQRRRSGKEQPCRMGEGSLTFSDDGCLLCASAVDGRGRQVLLVWDVTPVRELVAQRRGWRAALQPVEAAAKARAASLPELRVVGRQVSDFPISRIRFSPFDVGRLVSVGRENVRLWRIKAGHLPGCPVALNKYARETEFLDVAFDAPFASSSGAGRSNALSRFTRRDPVPAAHQRRMYVGSSAGSVLQVNYDTQALEAVFQLHSGPVHSLAVNEGFCVTASNDGFLRMWPLDFSAFFLEARYDCPVTGVALHPSGLTLVTTALDGSVGRLDVAAHEHRVILRSHTAPVLAVAVNPLPVVVPPASGVQDGTPEDVFRSAATAASIAAAPAPTVATASTDGTIRVWGLTGWEQQAEFRLRNVDDTATCLAFAPSFIWVDGQGAALPASQQKSAPQLLVAGFATGCLRVFDVAAAATLEEYSQHTAPIAQLAFLPDPTTPLLFSAARDGTVCVYDAAHSYLPMKMLTSHSPARLPSSGSSVGISHLALACALAVAPDGSTLAVAFSGACDELNTPGVDSTAAVYLLDPYSLSLLGQLPIPSPRQPAGEAAAAAAAQAGRAANLAAGGRSALHGQPVTGAGLPREAHAPLGITRLVFSPDGRCVVGGTLDGRLVRWDVASRKVLQQVRGAHPPRQLDALKQALSQPHDNARAAASVLHAAQTRGVAALDVTGDGSTVLAGGGSGTISAFDATLAGPPRAVPLGHRLHTGLGALSSLLFTPDGRGVVMTTVPPPSGNAPHATTAAAAASAVGSSMPSDAGTGAGALYVWEYLAPSTVAVPVHAVRGTSSSVAPADDEAAPAPAPPLNTEAHEGAPGGSGASSSPSPAERRMAHSPSTTHLLGNGGGGLPEATAEVSEEWSGTGPGTEGGVSPPRGGVIQGSFAVGPSPTPDMGPVRPPALPPVHPRDMSFGEGSTAGMQARDDAGTPAHLDASMASTFDGRADSGWARVAPAESAAHGFVSVQAGAFSEAGESSVGGDGSVGGAVGISAEFGEGDSEVEFDITPLKPRGRRARGVSDVSTEAGSHWDGGDDGHDEDDMTTDEEASLASPWAKVAPSPHAAAPPDPPTEQCDEGVHGDATDTAAAPPTLMREMKVLGLDIGCRRGVAWDAESGLLAFAAGGRVVVEDLRTAGQTVLEVGDEEEEGEAPVLDTTVGSAPGHQPSSSDSKAVTAKAGRRIVGISSCPGGQLLAVALAGNRGGEVLLWKRQTSDTLPGAAATGGHHWACVGSLVLEGQEAGVRLVAMAVDPAGSQVAALAARLDDGDALVTAAVWDIRGFLGLALGISGTTAGSGQGGAVEEGVVVEIAPLVQRTLALPGSFHSGVQGSAALDTLAWVSPGSFVGCGRAGAFAFDLGGVHAFLESQGGGHHSRAPTLGALPPAPPSGLVVMPVLNDDTLSMRAAPEGDHEGPAWLAARPWITAADCGVVAVPGSGGGGAVEEAARLLLLGDGEGRVWTLQGTSHVEGEGALTWELQGVVSAAAAIPKGAPSSEALKCPPSRSPYAPLPSHKALTRRGVTCLALGSGGRVTLGHAHGVVAGWKLQRSGSSTVPTPDTAKPPAAVRGRPPLRPRSRGAAAAKKPRKVQRGGKVIDVRPASAKRRRVRRAGTTSSRGSGTSRRPSTRGSSVSGRSKGGTRSRRKRAITPPPGSAAASQTTRRSVTGGSGVSAGTTPHATSAHARWLLRPAASTKANGRSRAKLSPRALLALPAPAACIVGRWGRGQCLVASTDAAISLVQVGLGGRAARVLSGHPEQVLGICAEPSPDLTRSVMATSTSGAVQVYSVQGWRLAAKVQAYDFGVPVSCGSSLSPPVAPSQTRKPRAVGLLRPTSHALRVGQPDADSTLPVRIAVGYGNGSIGVTALGVPESPPGGAGDGRSLALGQSEQVKDAEDAAGGAASPGRPAVAPVGRRGGKGGSQSSLSAGLCGVDVRRQCQLTVHGGAPVTAMAWVPLAGGDAILASGDGRGRVHCAVLGADGAVLSTCWLFAGDPAATAAVARHASTPIRHLSTASDAPGVLAVGSANGAVSTWRLTLLQSGVGGDLLGTASCHVAEDASPLLHLPGEGAPAMGAALVPGSAGRHLALLVVRGGATQHLSLVQCEGGAVLGFSPPLQDLVGDAVTGLTGVAHVANQVHNRVLVSLQQRKSLAVLSATPGHVGQVLAVSAAHAEQVSAAVTVLEEHPDEGPAAASTSVGSGVEGVLRRAAYRAEGHTVQVPRALAAAGACVNVWELQ